MSQLLIKSRIQKRGVTRHGLNLYVDICIAGHFCDRENMIGQNSWTNWAREPVKPSLNSGDSTESNERDKNIPLHSNLRQIYICAYLCICRIDFLAIFRVSFGFSNICSHFRSGVYASPQASHSKKATPACFRGEN